jgi:hypothetical protein
MLRLLTDQNFNGRILRGLRRRVASLDVVRTFDAGLASLEDPDVLEWAAKEERIVVSHDVNTMTAFAYNRVRMGVAMPGVFIVPTSMAIGQAIDELEFAVDEFSAADCSNRVIYFPL